MNQAIATGRPATVGEVRSSVPYVLPFALFVVFLALSESLSFLGGWEYLTRVGILSLALLVFSRHVLGLRVSQPVASVGLGILVFLIWIGPDFLIPGYRDHWLFQNNLTGRVKTSLPENLRSDVMVLAFRSIRATILVPIIEELFWRAWLVRWLIDREFWRLPLGAITTSSLWLTSLLFASEHGPYWEVGLVAGLLYNWWMVRTKSLGDCVLAHGVTNGCICYYAIATRNWQYWM